MQIAYDKTELDSDNIDWWVRIQNSFSRVSTCSCVFWVFSGFVCIHKL